FERVPVPKGGLAMPNDVQNGKTVRALGKIDVANNSFASADTGRTHNSLRISVPLGEVTLNFTKATNGLAHGVIVSPEERNSAAKQTAWSNGDVTISDAAAKANAQDTGASSNGNGNANANGIGLGNGNSAANGNGVASGAVNGVANGLANGVGSGN